MSVVVRKSSLVFVRPSEPVTTTGSVDLSPYDKFCVAMPRTVLLLFEDPIQEPAETIRKGLSQALVHYYPISGRLAAGDTTTDVHINCIGEGVSFVAASANCTINDVEFFDEPLLDELAIDYPAEGCNSIDLPLLMMQVTEFSCGGFVVGVTWNHGIADAAGISQFLRAVGELARGLSSPSVVPVRSWHDSLAVVPPHIVAMLQARLSLPKSDMAVLDMIVPSSLINRIKEKFSVGSNGQPCTTFEAITAVLWQCRTRVIISDPEALTALSFMVDARKYLVVKDGYYGNCITPQLVVAPSGTVANGDTIDVVKMIQHGKRQTADLFKEDGGSNRQHPSELLGYNYFRVTSWRNLGIDEADFGGGRPARVMKRTQHRTGLPKCVLCLPCKGKDGPSVWSNCVKDEHADAFLGELARFT